jgi:hypothetical protein
MMRPRAPHEGSIDVEQDQVGHGYPIVTSTVKHPH